MRTKRKRRTRRTKKKPLAIVGEVLAPTRTLDVDIFLNGDVKEGDFVFAFDENKHKVIARISNIEADMVDSDKVEHFANADILGYIDDTGLMKRKRFPLRPATKIFKFKADELAKFLKMDTGMFIGYFEESDVEIRINPSKLLREPSVFFGRTGSGKSWTLGVMLEEILKFGLPALVIDPHGEYESLSRKYAGKAGLAILKEQGLEPISFPVTVFKVNPDLSEVEEGEPYFKVWVPQEGDPSFRICELEFDSYRNRTGKMLREFDPNELLEAVEAIRSKVQGRKIVIGCGKYVGEGKTSNPDIKRLPSGMYAISIEEKDADIRKIIKPDSVGVVNMRNIDPESTRVVCAELLDTLFLERKKGNVPPFITVIEEAHIFAPSVGREYSSGTLEMLAKEGRKFGNPTWYVSQRPQLLSTTIRANCGNWIVLRVTHPSDQAAIIGACEGLDTQSVKHLKNLPVGTAMITGTMVDFPLLVRVRHRQTAHSYESGFKEKLDQWKDGG